MNLGEALSREEVIVQSIRHTARKNGPLWFGNAARNARRVETDVMSLPHSPARNLVICASGSSLTGGATAKLLHEMKSNPDWDIWVSPTNYSAVRKGGITPDVLVAVDGSDVQEEVIGYGTERSDLPGGTVLLASPYTAPALVKRAGENTWWFLNLVQQRYDEENLNEHLRWLFPHIQSGVLMAGNVTNAMLLLAKLLTQRGVRLYERIVLAGYDLSGRSVPLFRYERNSGWVLRPRSMLADGHIAMEVTYGMKTIATTATSVSYARAFSTLYASHLDEFRVERAEEAGLLWHVPLVDEEEATLSDGRRARCEAWSAWAARAREATGAGAET